VVKNEQIKDLTERAREVYLTAPEDRTPSAGPAATLTGLVPDLHHYNGRGGRVFPLWRDSAARVPNVKPALLKHLTEAYGLAVSANDVMSYIGRARRPPRISQKFR